MHSRLPLDPGTNLPSINSFGELSQFLRSAVSDEDSRMLTDSMAHMAVHIEAIVAALRLNRRRDLVAPQLVDLLTVLRTHRNLVVGLSLAWRSLYEYAGYLQALNNFRVLIGQWLLEGGPDSQELGLSAMDFEMVGWRTLGEGMLMIDMYDQWRASEPKGDDTQPMDHVNPSEPQVARAIQWWKKLRL
ncbi:MAG: hypothetical protein HY854_23810 [Burkholderiales bacterium]|nr:hypothetical protein [Burkholderiales bacterium]